MLAQKVILVGYKTRFGSVFTTSSNLQQDVPRRPKHSYAIGRGSGVSSSRARSLPSQQITPLYDVRAVLEDIGEWGNGAH